MERVGWLVGVKEAKVGTGTGYVEGVTEWATP